MKNKPFIDVYSKSKPITINNFDMEANFSFVDFIIESMVKKETKQKSDMICNKLFELYKNCKIASVYSINRKQFERFLKEMLPIWIRKEKEDKQ